MSQGYLDHKIQGWAILHPFYLFSEKIKKSRREVSRYYIGRGLGGVYPYQKYLFFAVFGYFIHYKVTVL